MLGPLGARVGKAVGASDGAVLCEVGVLLGARVGRAEGVRDGPVGARDGPVGARDGPVGADDGLVDGWAEGARSAQ